MILTSKQIENEKINGNIHLNPFDKRQINPNSYNYRLGRYLKESINSTSKGLGIEFRTIDLLQYEEGYTIKPGHFYLGSTFEEIGSEKYAMSLIGRSSMGRYGMFLQVSANLGHTGSSHNWTLEIVPLIKINLYYKMIVGQVSFWNNHGEVELTKHTYNTFSSPTESKVWE